ncbi:DUF58 domain-containing protein [Lederbergia wuyishanensis]|uniref:Uncharacterized protein (DUF58 family) n=1 Tax=Lederbergia wuyishanensis TaxID=1347903 RepID=A0ABU0D6N5_9BACI|nr:DUF58 domain-containing protein [Lederbergia wuyishanensis]MCJ8008749.1 DUF58 domain-containing protein [Lederbergia wuyishanensis]MDQ0344069.1 uncharacterized protein (DUF58 family) [Lederbergia wuyishanensis]
MSWFLFFSFLPFAIYSIALLIYPLNDFQLKRVFSPLQLTAGDQVTVKISLNRKFPFPLLFLVVADWVPDEFYYRESKKILFPGFKRNLEFYYKIDKIPRGEHVFEAIRFKTGDALGLVEKEKWVDCREVLLVYPQHEEIEYRSLESQFEQGGTVSAMQFQKDTSLVAGIRQYQPGDRFSWIDWKAFARTNDMMTKEFEIRQTNDLLIILDRTKTKNFEETVKFVASITKSVLKYGGQIGLFSAGDDKTFFPIRGGDQQQQQIFLHLAKVKADSSVPLANIIETESILFTQPAVMIVVTSVLSKELVDQAGVYMRRRGTFIVYYIKKQNDPISQEELIIKSSAMQKGIIMISLYEDEFRTAFSEVKRA